MTEDEAKTKWCPMAASRVVTVNARDDSLDVARWIDDEEKQIGGLTTTCIASDCMMWIENEGYAFGDDEVVPPDGDGRCGLAK